MKHTKEDLYGKNIQLECKDASVLMGIYNLVYPTAKITQNTANDKFAFGGFVWFLANGKFMDGTARKDFSTLDGMEFLLANDPRLAGLNNEEYLLQHKLQQIQPPKPTAGKVCTKPECNCLEIAEYKAGGMVKNFACLAHTAHDELKKPLVQANEAKAHYNLRDHVEALTKRLRADEDLFNGYQSNIAMSVLDAMAARGIKHPELYHACNEGAKRFLDAWCKEDK